MIEIELIEHVLRYHGTTATEGCLIEINQSLTDNDHERMLEASSQFFDERSEMAKLATLEIILREKRLIGPDQYFYPPEESY